MSEPAPVYTVHTARAEPTPSVTCPTCGAEIGHYVQVGRRVCLHVGALVLLTLDGTCAVCGASFHFDASMKRLDDLIARMKARRE